MNLNKRKKSKLRKRSKVKTKRQTPNSVDVDSRSLDNEKRPSILHALKKTSFLVIWLYFILRFFITDIDGFFFPEKMNISSKIYILLRLLICSGLILLIWLYLGNKRFWKNVGLFFLFPIYPIGWTLVKNSFWDFPNFAFRYKLDFLLFSYFDAIISLLVRFKITLLKWIGFITATVLMISFDNEVLYFSIALFSILQLSHLYKRWLELFGPVKLFQINLSEFNVSAPFSHDDIANHIDKNSDKNGKNKDFKSMENLILIHQFMKLFDSKVQSTLNSKAYMKSFIVKAFYSVIYAMIVFSAINYCLYQIDSSHYKIELTSLGYFDFLFYSFFTIIPDGTNITPLTYASKTVKMLGVLIGYGINILIFALYIGINSKKFQENLEKVSVWSSNSSTNLTEYFSNKYGKNPIEGYEWLRQKGSQIETTIETLSKLLRQKKPK